MASSLEDIGKALAAADAAGAVDDAKALAKLYNHRKIELQIENDPISQGARNFAKDMPWYQQGAAGAGKAVADIGLGARQMTGNASQQEVDETKQRDSALMNTGAGMTGNIIGNIGMSVAPGLGAVGAGRALGMQGMQAAGKYALASPLSIGGAVTQGTMGASQGAMQPVATGESRAGNAIVGGIGGAAIPAAGMAIKGGKAAIEPLYEGGRQQIMARALREATNDNPQVIQNLRNARELVPGSAPTAAEVGNSGGLAAMQRAASAVDPESYATRAAQQNEARVSALQGLTGTAPAREAAEQARDTTAGAFYKQAREAGIDPQVAQMLAPQIKNLTERMPSGVMEKARELARINGEVMGKDGSIDGLHWVKLAVDDLLSGAKQTGIGKQTERGLMQFKNDLLSVMDELSPAYKQGRESYAALSKPINQMDVAGEIASKATDPLTGSLRPQSYARALSDDTAARATGFGKATLADTMEPSQLASLNAIKDDLARSVAARDLGRGAGSDTVQKLSMTNLMQGAGLPLGLIHAPGIGRLGNWAYEKTDDKMKAALAKALLNPKDAATIMEKGIPSETVKKLAAALKASAPVGSGAAVGLLDAR